MFSSSRSSVEQSTRSYSVLNRICHGQRRLDRLWTCYRMSARLFFECWLSGPAKAETGILVIPYAPHRFTARLPSPTSSRLPTRWSNPAAVVVKQLLRARYCAGLFSNLGMSARTSRSEESRRTESRVADSTDEWQLARFLGDMSIYTTYPKQRSQLVRLAN